MAELISAARLMALVGAETADRGAAEGADLPNENPLPQPLDRVEPDWDGVAEGFEEENPLPQPLDLDADEDEDEDFEDENPPPQLLEREEDDEEEREDEDEEERELEDDPPPRPPNANRGCTSSKASTNDRSTLTVFIRPTSLVGRSLWNSSEYNSRRGFIKTCLKN